MKTSSLCRAGALLLSLAAPSFADVLLPTPDVKYCTGIYIDCAPYHRFNPGSCSCVPDGGRGNICPAVQCGRGMRMDRQTCSCVSDGRGGFDAYEMLGADLRDAVGSGDQASVSSLLSARFDGLAASGGTAAPAVAAYADASAARYTVSPSRRVEPGDIRSPDEVKKPVPPLPGTSKPKLGRSAYHSASRPRFVLVGNTDANPMGHDNAVVGAVTGAIGGASGGVVGAVGGAVGGAAAGAYADLKEKQSRDEESYRRGNEARERDQRERNRR